MGGKGKGGKKKRRRKGRKREGESGQRMSSSFHLTPLRRYTIFSTVRKHYPKKEGGEKKGGRKKEGQKGKIEEEPKKKNLELSHFPVMLELSPF